MGEWSHGYNITTGYTFGFYRETTPDWMDFAVALRGVISPRRDASQSFRYLELGCGQGFGLCLQAASNPNGKFVGIDFSPEHIAHARGLAGELGLRNVEFHEADFGALGRHWPPELGDFEYVVLHGIYSWVSVDLRQAIVDCLAAALAPGGIVYVSYNAMPGWTSTIPLQHVLQLIGKRGPNGSGLHTIGEGRALFQKLEAAGSSLTKSLPALKSRVENIASQPPAYLVQEYLHENWHPMWASQVHEELSPAKLTRVGTATLPESLLPGILPEQHRQLLAGYSDQVVREDLVDALINQTFRRDLYCRGPRMRFSGDAGWQKRFRFWRTNSAPVPREISVNTAYGTVTMKAAKYAFILGAIGESSATIVELLTSAPAGTETGPLLQALLLLVHSGWLYCGTSEADASLSAGQINAHIARLAALGGPYRYLAAPRVQSAIRASEVEILLFDAYNQDPDAFTTDAVGVLKARLAALGQRIAVEGQSLTDVDEEAHLSRMAHEFESVTLPAWRRFGVAH